MEQNLKTSRQDKKRPMQKRLTCILSALGKNLQTFMACNIRKPWSSSVCWPRFYFISLQNSVAKIYVLVSWKGARVHLPSMPPYALPLRGRDHGALMLEPWYTCMYICTSSCCRLQHTPSACSFRLNSLSFLMKLSNRIQLLELSLTGC